MSAACVRPVAGRSKSLFTAMEGRGADLWWEQNRDKLSQIKNLCVFNLPIASSQGLVALAQRNMQLQCTIQDKQVWLANDDDRLEVLIETLTGQ